MQRYSKKRQAILDCLKNTTSHPTAEWIYSEIKKEYPDISLATVYRNLSQLKDAGEIRSLGKVGGKERYDGNLGEHSHVICSVCGKTIDVFELSLPADFEKKVEGMTGFEIVSSEITFKGICADCKKSR